MKTHLIALATMLLNTGCATFYAQQSDLTPQIDDWLEQQRFDLALDTINAMSAEHPQYGSLIASVPAIKAERQQFILQVLNDAKPYEANQDWVRAEAIIKQGLERLPDAPELVSQAEYYDQNRALRLDRDQSAIIIAKAHYVIQARPFQESKLYNADDRLFARQEYNRFQSDAQQVSRELFALGQKYHRNDQLIQAKEALTLSIQTAPNDLSSSLLADIEAVEAERQSASSEQQKRNANEQIPELTSAFYAQISNDDFTAAERQVREISTIDADTAQKLQATLIEMKSARIVELIRSGETLYNAGNIRQAAERWRLASELDPENQDIARQLERAETFLENLERWQNSDAPESEKPTP